MKSELRQNFLSPRSSFHSFIIHFFLLVWVWFLENVCTYLHGCSCQFEVPFWKLSIRTQFLWVCIHAALGSIWAQFGSYHSSGPVTVQVLSQFGSCHSSGPVLFFFGCVYIITIFINLFWQSFRLCGMPSRRYMHINMYLYPCVPKEPLSGGILPLRKYVCMIINLQFTHIFSPVFPFEWNVR